MPKGDQQRSTGVSLKKKKKKKGKLREHQNPRMMFGQNMRQSCLAMLVILLMTSSPCDAYREILEMAETSMFVWDTGLYESEGVGVKNLRDKDVFTGYHQIAGQGQGITIEWTTEMTVNGVFLHTDQSQMTSGVIIFLAWTGVTGWVACTDMSDVGINGGVFNCGLTATKFLIYCADTCAPYFAVNEIKLFQDEAVSIYGTPYWFNGNTSTMDADKVFKSGSYLTTSSDTWTDIYQLEKGTANKVGLNLRLAQTVTVTQIITITQGTHSQYRLSIGTRSFDEYSDIQQDDSETIQAYSGNIPTYNEIQGSWEATDFSSWRAPINDFIHWNKIILLAEYCDATSQSGELTVTYTQPASIFFNEIGMAETFQAPSYQVCGEEIDSSDIQFKFFEISPNANDIDALDWVSIDTDSNTITVEPSLQAYQNYQGSHVQIKIAAEQQIFPYRVNVDTTIQIYIESLVTVMCSSSEILLPIALTTQFYEMYATNATLFEIGEILDSGTGELQSTPGFESESCGDFLVEAMTLATIVQQDSSNQNLFKLETDDINQIGNHVLQVKITSLSWVPQIDPILYYVDIVVTECLVTELVEPEDVTTSSLYLAFSIPYSQTIELPRYLPSPHCEKTNADLVYEVVDTLPDWITFDAEDRTVQVDAEDTSLNIKTQTVTIKASYNDLVKEISFAVTFIQRSSETPQEQTTATVQELQTEPEPEEEKIEDIKEEVETNGWDGWKSLLDINLYLPEGVTLPKRNPDPNYVPTPPIPSILEVSPRGKTQIKFSEDVFEYEDLKNLKIRKPPSSRALQQEISIDEAAEEVNFIQVYVEPGEESDPSKLGFDYKVSFSDAQTIDIEMIWENPPYVSANDPEDVLVIKFNGPFLDKQDGVDIEQSLKVIRQVIPPQLVLGGLTDSIQGAGGSLQVASASAVASNAAINLLLAGSLNQVWGMINNLQLVLHVPLITVQFPANAFMIFDLMISVATFDLLPTDDIFPIFFPKLPEEDPFTDKFDRMDIGSRFIIMNMGTMLIILTFYLILYTIYPCVRFLKDEISCCKKMEKVTSNMLFWNHAILFLQEGFLDILIAAAINITYFGYGSFEFDDWSLVLSNFLCIFLSLCCTILFFFVTFYLWPRFNLLNKKRFKKKFGAVYEMLQLRHGKWTMLWPIFFMIRRTIFVIAVCFLMEHTSLQILLFMFPTLVVLMIIALVKPLQDEQTNKLEIYNSFTILCISYCLMCFTPFVLDAEARYTMGYVLVILTCQNVLVNIVIIGKDPLHMTKLRCKNRWLRRHQIKRNLLKRASTVKNFYQRTFTRRPAPQSSTIIDEEDLKISQQLSIINEDANESIDSKEEIKVELQKLDIGDLNTKNRSIKAIEDDVIRKLNQKALVILEERRVQGEIQAIQAAAQKAVKDVKKLSNQSVGQNPKLTKYSLPNIDDLVSNLTSSIQIKQVRTLSGLQYKARQLQSQERPQFRDSPFELAEDHVRVNQISFDSADYNDQSNNDDKRDDLEDTKSMLIMNKKPSQRYLVNVGSLDIDEYAGEKSKNNSDHWTSIDKIQQKTMNIPFRTSPVMNKEDQVVVLDQMKSTYNSPSKVDNAVKKAGGWLDASFKNLFDTSRRVYDDKSEEPEGKQTSRVEKLPGYTGDLTPIAQNLNPQENAILGLKKTSVFKMMGQTQTTKMKDGQVVLFPEMYTERYGIQEEEATSTINVVQQSSTMLSDPIANTAISVGEAAEQQSKQSKKSRKSKKRDKKLTQATQSQAASEQTAKTSKTMQEMKQDLRDQVMSKFAQGLTKKKSKNKKALKLFNKGLNGGGSDEDEAIDEERPDPHVSITVTNLPDEPKEEVKTQKHESKNALKSIKRTGNILLAIQKIQSHYKKQSPSY